LKNDDVAIKGNFSRPVLLSFVLVFVLLYLEVFLFSICDQSVWFSILLFAVLLIVNMLASVFLTMLLMILWDSVLLPTLNKWKIARLKKRVTQ